MAISYRARGSFAEHGADTPSRRAVGATSPQLGEGVEALQTARKERPKVNTASNKLSSTSASTGGGSRNMQVGSVNLDIDMEPLLTGMAYDVDDKALFDVYRDIYNFDPIGGSYVDMMSTLPYSEISLGGAKDALLDPYYETLERLRIVSLLPQITTDRLVTGAHVSSMLYDKSKKQFLDLMTHRYDDIDVFPLPFRNQDPVLEWRVPKEMAEVMARDSPRVKQLRSYIGSDLCAKIDGNETIELDPMGTLWLPRSPFSYGEGQSAFKRLLPIWLIEKNLYRGTLIESGRRQRGILHAQMGDGMEWEPSVEEMQFITDLLLSADADPIGAVIATRNGVAINEFRQGGDFWKITDIWDQTSQYKLRALGASEALLSGDATFSNGETGLMAFMESMAAARSELTRALFYQKVFPMVAIINGLAVSRSGSVIRKSGMMNGDAIDVLNRMQDGSSLFIPTVHWTKRLRPESDQGQMEALRTMTEMGVPVPLRAIAAAGGYNLDQLLGDQDENLAMQRRMLDYKKRLKQLEKSYGPAEGEDEGGEGGGSFSSVQRKSLRDRDFGVYSEAIGIGKTGKPKAIMDQRAANEKANNAIYRHTRLIERQGLNPVTAGGMVSYSQSAREKKALKRFY